MNHSLLKFLHIDNTTPCRPGLSHTNLLSSRGSPRDGSIHGGGAFHETNLTKMHVMKQHCCRNNGSWIMRWSDAEQFPSHTPQFLHDFNIQNQDAVALFKEFPSFNNMVEIFKSHPPHTTSCKSSLPFNRPHVFRHQGILWFSSQQTPLVQWLARRWNNRSTRSLHLPRFGSWDGKFKNVTCKNGVKHATAILTTTLFCKKRGKYLSTRKIFYTKTKELKLNRSWKNRHVANDLFFIPSEENKNHFQQQKSAGPEPQFGKGLHPCTKSLGSLLRLFNPRNLYPVAWFSTFWPFTKETWKVGKGWDLNGKIEIQSKFRQIIYLYWKYAIPTTNHEFHHHDTWTASVNPHSNSSTAIANNRCSCGIRKECSWSSSLESDSDTWQIWLNTPRNG